MGIILAVANLGQVAGTSIATYIGYAPWAVLLGIIGGIVMVIRARKQAAAYNNIGMTGPYGNSQPQNSFIDAHPQGIFSQAASFVNEKLNPSKTSLQPQYPSQQQPQNYPVQDDTMANGQPQNQPQPQAQSGMINMNNTVNLPVSIWAANVINVLAKKHKRTETSIIDQLCEYYLNTKGQGGQQGGGQRQGGRNDSTKQLLQGLGKMSDDFMSGQGFWR